MHLQIGYDLRTVHNAQLVYSNSQDIALTLLNGFKIWLVHNCQTEEDHLNIKIVTALLLYFIFIFIQDILYFKVYLMSC